MNTVSWTSRVVLAANSWEHCPLDNFFSSSSLLSFATPLFPLLKAKQSKFEDKLHSCVDSHGFPITYHLPDYLSTLLR